MRRLLFDWIKDKQKFSHTHLNQVYLQLELLSAKVCGSAKHGLESVFIEEYFDILSAYTDIGLSKDIFVKEKSRFAADDFPIV